MTGVQTCALPISRGQRQTTQQAKQAPRLEPVAETRLLMVITDGRPFDLDYGADYPGREIEYANRDTQVAVEEALAQGIEPFVLTVDGEGHEYLSEVFQSGGGYEVVADIDDLRSALVRSYTRVRAGASRAPRRANRLGAAR